MLLVDILNVLYVDVCIYKMHHINMANDIYDIYNI